MGDTTRVLFIGDIIGRPGRKALKHLLPKVIGESSPDLVVVNGENASGGFGITAETASELFGSLHVDVITSGNHIWDKKEAVEFIGGEPRLLRPQNYPAGTPGKGYGVYECPSGVKVGVINLEGRVFMDSLDCPFRAADEAVKWLKAETQVIIVDIHAEATSEKAAMGHYLDGRVSAVIGTHTHVQTSDERVLPGGTAFITDAGMTGPTDSVIGVKKEIIIERFLTQMPLRFEVASRGVELQGALVTIRNSDGRAVGIERIKRQLNGGVDED